MTTFKTGTKLGPYEILAQIGAGGMGEVYRATDTRLDRAVAIKVLPERFSKDADRLRRFEQEARVTGSLNHPNILAIYDFGAFDGAPYVVSEFLEGETLREALHPGAIAPRRAIDYATQIASGLAAAHDKGVVHRDLKPENLFITKDGRIKILDFGLAKLTESPETNLSALPTVANLTDPGVVLGTAGYMSPEQVRGQNVDHRSDIFAFGAILYEMVSGTRAFQRDSAADTMSAILKEEPPELPSERANVPAALERILRRCLEKQTERRFRSASDLGFALETLSAPSSSGAAIVREAERESTPILSGWRRGLLLAAAALVAGVVLGVFIREPLRAPLTDWSGSLLAGGSTIAFGPRVSPNGQMVAFQIMIDRVSQVAVLQVSSGDWEVRTSERSSGYTRNVSWSSDGSTLFFDRVSGARDRVMSVPAVGGPERLVLDDAKLADSLPDGSLLVTRSIAGRYRLFRFWPDASKPEESLPVFPIDAIPSQVRAFPGGDHAVFYGYVEGDSAATAAHVFKIDLNTKKVLRLAPDIAVEGQALGYTATLSGMPLAVSPDGTTVLLSVPSGDLERIVAAPVDGSSSVRTLLTVTARPYVIDVAADGSIYLDQVDDHFEVVRTTADGASVDRGVKSTIPPDYCSNVMALSDGRILFPTRLAGRMRLVVTSPGKEPKPFAAPTEESAPPIALLDSDEVAFLLGRGDEQVIGVASPADGRLIRRIDLPAGTQIACMAGSPDGKSIYYVSIRTLWRLPSTGGAPQKLTEADAVAVHPRTGEIMLQRKETGGVHFFRFDPANGREQRIEIRDAEAPPAVGPLSSGAVAPDGRIALIIAPPDTWDWEIGILDPASLVLKRVRMNYAGGLNSPAWTRDGRIVFAGGPWQSSVWRFRPSAESSQSR